jgi:hypothetical protein
MRRTLILSLFATLLSYAAFAQGPPATPSVPNLAALKNLPSTQAKVIHRQGFFSPGDGGDATYNSSPSACTLNLGNGDDGAEVKARDGGCFTSLSPIPGSLAQSPVHITSSTSQPLLPMATSP